MLKVSNLKVQIDTPQGIVKAVDGVSFTIKRGETVGIVGESGSGKSVLAQSIMRLNVEPTTFYPEGRIQFENQDILTMKEKALWNIRKSDISMIFQDPMTSLNPVFTIGNQLIEAIRAKEKIKRKDARKRAIELLGDVGIAEAERRLSDYPHQFSGGMRQRVLIAIALASKPKLLIADEPTTALDVTIQAQILALLKSIQKKYQTAIILITHDLGVIANIADRALVMYGGRIVESGTVEDVFYRPKMPYTWSLLRALPRLTANKQARLVPIKGQPPNLIHSPKGCNFAARCPFATKKCLEIDPELRGDGAHKAACILSAERFHQLKLDMETSEKQVILDKGVAL